MKVYWVVEVYLHAFLTLAFDGGTCSTLHLGERAPGTKWEARWVPELVWMFCRREMCGPYCE
jgi:hypothetical protein